MSNFLSGVAVVLSILALITSGYSAYQVLELRKDVDTADNLQSNATATDNQTPLATPDAQTTPEANTAIQPKQFVQPALDGKAQVELLSVRRIAHPDNGLRNVVNVQFRLRRVTPDVAGSEALFPAATTASNSITNDSYKAVWANRATPSIALDSIGQNASVDAYVWLQVPQGTNSLDIYVPNTQPFKNVPISN